MAVTEYVCTMKSVDMSLPSVEYSIPRVPENGTGSSHRFLPMRKMLIDFAAALQVQIRVVIFTEARCNYTSLEMSNQQNESDDQLFTSNEATFSRKRHLH